MFPVRVQPWGTLATTCSGISPPPISMRRQHQRGFHSYEKRRRLGARVSRVFRVASYEQGGSWPFTIPLHPLRFGPQRSPHMSKACKAQSRSCVLCSCDMCWRAHLLKREREPSWRCAPRGHALRDRAHCTSSQHSEAGGVRPMTTPSSSG